MRYRPLAPALCLALAVSVASAFALLVPSRGSATVSSWNVLSNPINSGQLTQLPFGERSYWLQPWRSQLVTRPATALQDAIGVNLGTGVTAKEVGATAQLLHDSGFRRARVEIAWNQVSYADPRQMADPGKWTRYLTALRDNGIRPLILLNGNDQSPGPMVALNLTLTAPAAAGATTVALDAASAAQVVPGLTGIDEGRVAAQVLITSVSPGGVATLSQPLPGNLQAGPVAASTLRYEPFAPPYLANGSPNPRFQQTLAGWLTYVKTVTQFVRNVYGSDNFDVEVWNELSWGSGFLNESKYFSPVPDPGSFGDVHYALLAATAQWLKDPANGLTDVKVGDGFSNQIPYASGATVPPGTDAIDKHPYAPLLDVSPGSKPVEHDMAVGALGRLGGKEQPPVFTPTLRAFFPEYYLTGIQTETLMRDLSPIQTSIGGTLHGAGTHPAGSAAPGMWITEDNLDGTKAMANGLPAAYLPELQAKAAMRFYVSYASMGAQAIDLFAAKGGPGFSLIPKAFFTALDANPGSYPASLAGPTMQAMGRLTSTLSGAQPIANPRQLTLDAIAQSGTDSQFTGNGTAAYPTLYNRDVLAFFPFQVTPSSFVVPVYVMTRDLTHHYTSSPAPGQTPYDLPAEEYQLTIGNVDAASATVSLSDPLTGTQEPATIVSRNGSQIVVQLAATDSPRMLTINDSGTVPPTTTTTTPTTTPTPITTPPATTPATATAATTPATAPAAGSSSGGAFTLTAPVKVSAAGAAGRGVTLGIKCEASTPCSVAIAAMSSPSGASPASVYGASTAHLAAGQSVDVTLKMGSKGRSSLRSRATTRMRIAAWDTQGSATTKIIAVTHAPRWRGPRRVH